MKKKADKIGNGFITCFHYVGLFLIGGVVAWSGFIEILNVLKEGHPGIESVLTLFIYLELGAMVGIYFKTNHMPIRFLLYVGVTAMIRHLIGIISDHGEDYKMVMVYCLGILVLSLSIFIVRYGTFKFPSETKPEQEKEEHH